MIQRVVQLHAVLCLALVALGVVLALDFHTGGPAAPARFLLPDPVLAYFAVGGLLVVLALAPRRWYRALSMRGAAWSLVLALALLGGTLWIGGRIADAFLSLLILLLAPILACTLWARARDDARLLLASDSLLGIGLVVFGVEALGSEHGAPAGVFWGTPETFAFEFAKKPPYLGPGGRLRPNLDLYMYCQDRPQGAHLVTDSHGFRNDEEIAAEPADGVLRVLNLGDSFSIGMQIDQRDFLGPKLERLLAEKLGRAVEVVNAETSDPAYGLYFYQEHGRALGARIVLYGLCANDMMQVDNFVGEDRVFRLDATGRLVPDPAAPGVEGYVMRYADLAYPTPAPGGAPERPPWHGPWAFSASERLLAKLMRLSILRPLASSRERRPAAPAVMHSYAAELERADGRMRYFDGTTNLGYFAKPPLAVLGGLRAKLVDVLAALDAAVTASGGRLVVLLFPQRFLVHAPDWEVIRDGWGLKDEDFDLTSNDSELLRRCAERGIACLDLLPAFRAAAPEGRLYISGGDMHPNTAGHRVAAEATAEFLCRELPEALDADVGR